ncbi:3897_t:CDS:1 [Entrophospora sp. SA101]|nr:3897_t:CDS:1 [Entrophospora sp. SA101]CAJ0843694.1 2459_t:CDS:1 [Entrophospora sp. SA101]
MIILVAVLFFLTINVAADGRMILPEIRNNFRNASLPAKHYPCGNDNGPGKVLTTYTTNQTIKVQWGIENPLDGSCFVDLSTTGKDNAFKNIHFMPNCADQVAKFQVDVQLPEHISCEHCTLRFRWVPHLSKEVYLNCADISILPPNKKVHPR